MVAQGQQSVMSITAPHPQACQELSALFPHTKSGCDLTTNRGAPMGDVLTPQQINEIEIKYKAFKVMYCSDMPLFSTDLLSDEEVSRIRARLSLLGQI